MPQYQARTGPITNQAATFSPEMAAGSQGAPFKRSTRSDSFRYNSIIAPPTILPFSPEMFFGCKPDRPRIQLGPRIGLPISQTTQVAAGITVDMFAGTRPTFPKAPRVQHIQPFAPQVLNFSFDSVLASRLDFRASWRKSLAQPMVPEAIHDPAEFSVEMADGASGGSTMRGIDRQMSRPFYADVTTFQFDSFAGNQPQRPRIQLGPRIGLPLSQTTQVNAGISVEMFAGQSPTAKRTHTVRQIPVHFVIHVDIFAFESIFGCKPDFARLFRKNQAFQTALSIAQFSHQPVDFSIEMVAGDVGTNLRLIPGRGNQRGQNLSQTTHVSVPFSVEMIAGNVPPRHRWTRSTTFQQPFMDMATVFNTLPTLINTGTRAVYLPYSTRAVNLPYETELE